MRLFIVVVVLLSVVLQSCTNSATDQQKPDDMTEKMTLFNEYDPNPEYLFGQVNSKAPEQTKQFDFMIGKFICKDTLLVNGEWINSDATWESEYILNGYGIKDTYRNHNYAGTSIRFFNTQKNKWDVYFFGMPGEHTGLWEGEYTDGKMIMKQKRTGPNGENLESRLTFYHITENSFDWKGELWNLDENSGNVNWKISANRTK